MTIEQLESQSGILRVVLFLLEDKASITDLVQTAKINQSALYKAIPKLIELGLIEEELGKRFPFKRIFKLTEKGELIAKHLNEIEKLLKS